MSIPTHFSDHFFDIFHDFDRLFDANWNERASSASRGIQRYNPSRSITGTLRPRMDLHESKDRNEVTATFELPGIKKEDINIEIRDNRLTVSGKSAASNAVDNENYRMRERYFGSFMRTVPLPIGTKAEDIKASMDDGVLTVKYPKIRPEQETKRITIS